MARMTFVYIWWRGTGDCMLTPYMTCTCPVGGGCVYVTCRCTVGDGCVYMGSACTVGDGLLYMTVDMYMKSK